MTGSSAGARNTLHATSGRNSSQRTAPEVAFSISGQRSAGTRRSPLFHCPTAADVTPKRCASAVADPSTAIARSMGVEAIVMSISPILKRRFSSSQLMLVGDLDLARETLAMLKTKDAATPEQRALAANFTKALAESGVPPKAIAEARDISEQAVSNWKRTGKIARAHLPTIAALTGWSVERLLSSQPMEGEQGTSSEKAIVLQHRAKKWPYRRIDYDKLVDLSGAAAINLENAILAAASEIDIDIRVSREANRSAA